MSDVKPAVRYGDSVEDIKSTDSILAAIGLDNVNNTSDAGKPVSTAQAFELVKSLYLLDNENISKVDGTPVCLTTSGKIRSLAGGGSDYRNSQFFGIVDNVGGIAANASGLVRRGGVKYLADWSAVEATGATLLTPGSTYFTNSTSGKIGAWSSFTSGLRYSTRIGYAISTTELMIDVSGIVVHQQFLSPTNKVPLYHIDGYLKEFSSSDRLEAVVNDASIVSNAAIAHSKLATMSTGNLMGNLSGSTAVPGSVTLAALASAFAANSFALTQLAAQATMTFLANLTGGSATPTAVTVTQVRTALLPSVAIIQHTTATNVGGGIATANAWTKRTLNTKLLDVDSIVTLSSSQMTLAAGTYKVSWVQHFFNTIYCHTRLRNITASADIAYGLTTYATGTGPGRSHMTTYFTLASSSVLELQYYTTSTGGTDALGMQMNSGSGNIHAYVEIEKRV